MKALFLVGMLFSLAALGQTQSPTWEAARAAIENDFARGDHGKLVQLSGPDRRELGLITVRWHGTALVQRADGTRWRERVLAEYKLVGDVWGSRACTSTNPPRLRTWKHPEKSKLKAFLWLPGRTAARAMTSRE